MRFSAIAGLAVAAFSTSSMADPTCYWPPANKLQPASVHYVVKAATPETIVEECGAARDGCTFPVDHHWAARLTVPWVVLLDSRIDHDRQVCVLRYEVAHMPPNNWIDPAIEGVTTFDEVAARDHWRH